MNWEALTAVSTFLAVLVSLYLSQQNKKPVKKLRIHQQFVQDFNNRGIKKVITIENLGNTPIIINEYGTRVKNPIVIDLTINKYLVNPYELILIKAGDAILLEYVHLYNDQFKEVAINDTPEYKLLKKFNFIARDTAGNIYK